MSFLTISTNTRTPGLINTPTFSPPLPLTSNPNDGSLYDENNSDDDFGIVNDQLANLLEVNFDGTPFPSVDFGEAGSQDLAMHKYPNLDSARIENTGRNPSTFTIRGIFTNNIYPSNNETWISGTLFPDVFNDVLISLYDTTSPIKTLIHPYLGNINVVVDSWKYNFVGKGPRDGVFMDMVFKETLAQNNIATNISPPNPSAYLANIGNSLDTLMSLPYSSDNILLGSSPPGIIFGTFFSSLSNTISQSLSNPLSIISPLNIPIFTANITFNNTISAQQFYQGNTTQYVNNNNAGNLVSGVNSGNPVINYNYQALQNVYNSCFSINSAQHNNANQFITATLNFLNNLAIYYASVNSVNTAEIKLNIYLMMNQLQTIQQTLFKNNNKYQVNVYIPTISTTLISLSNILNNTVNQLLSLNPNLNKTLLIKANTPVSYFQG